MLEILFKIRRSYDTWFCVSEIVHKSSHDLIMIYGDTQYPMIVTQAQVKGLHLHTLGYAPLLHAP